MSKSISKHLYFPTDLKIEVKHFLNGSIIWFSSYIYVLKKIIFSSVDINAKRKEHQLNFYLKNYYLNFYSLPPIPLKKKMHANVGLFKIEQKQHMISVLTAYQKILNLRGIGYKFTLAKSFLFLEVGYSHLLSFSWNRAFNVRFSRKLKSIQVKNRNLMILMSFLSSIKKIRPINVYTRKGIRYKNEILRYKEGKRKKSF